jgi:hypothetical protein
VPGGGAVHSIKSDRLLRCREMSLWANRDQSASQQFSEAKIALGIGGVKR